MNSWNVCPTGDACRVPWFSPGEMLDSNSKNADIVLGIEIGEYVERLVLDSQLLWVQKWNYSGD